MRISKLIVLFSCCGLSLLGTAAADGYAPEGSAEPVVKQKIAEPEPILLERAGGENLAMAAGHYGRARSHLISAVQEFDKGFKLARPDSLVNSKEWRDDIISRAEDLERILAPQPRVTKGGVRFEGYSRLLKSGSK